MKWEKLVEYDTVLTADSVEWCPHEPFLNIFICATYQNNTNGENTRYGRLFMFQFETDLLLLDKHETNGILDVKWSPHLCCSKIIVGVVDSIGQLSIYHLQESHLLKLVTAINLRPQHVSGDFLLLSLDWSRISPGLICVSDSTGGISLLTLTEARLDAVSTWKGHDLETWIVAFDNLINMVYSGSDDCKLKVWDPTNTVSPCHISKHHNAGVTSSHAQPKSPLLITGSYDETVALWDVRTMRKPLDTLGVSGGVWRLKWNALAPQYIIGACIYNGFHIIQNGSEGLSIVSSYSEHASLAYGADWSLIRPELNSFHISTCSFYDHKMTVSIWEY